MTDRQLCDALRIADRGAPSALRPHALPGVTVRRGASPGAPPSSSDPAPTENSAAEPVQPFRASGYVRAVNSATGLCPDIRRAAFANGVDVITTRCQEGASAQQRRLDEEGLPHNAANPGFCLDARGTTGDGVGVRSCSAPGKATGDNLVYSTDAAGRVEPCIAPAYAVTSDAPGAPVVLDRTGPAAEQRWNESSGRTPSGKQ